MLKQLEEIFLLKYNIKKLYALLADDLSKFIFLKRIMFSLTDDYKYIYEIVLSLLAKEEKGAATISLIEFMKKNKQKNIVIYGAGHYGKFIKHNFQRNRFLCYIDNDPSKQGMMVDGLPVFSSDFLDNFIGDFVICISVIDGGKEIYDEIVERGHIKKNIHLLEGALVTRIGQNYFDNEIIEPGKDEVFVDGGVFNGVSSTQFSKWCHGSYKKIYGFEPDRKNYLASIEYIKENPIRDMVIENYGLYNENTVIKFMEKGTSGSSVSEDGDSEIEVIKLDTYLEGREITYLKLDIEGAELAALKGAEVTIKKHRPKLAICLYHKPEDIFEILNYLQNLNCDYEFYIRHHSLFHIDTVLYARQKTENSVNR